MQLHRAADAFHRDAQERWVTSRRSRRAGSHDSWQDRPHRTTTTPGVAAVECDPAAAHPTRSWISGPGAEYPDAVRASGDHGDPIRSELGNGETILCSGRPEVHDVLIVATGSTEHRARSRGGDLVFGASRNLAANLYANTGMDVLTSMYGGAPMAFFDVPDIDKAKAAFDRARSGATT